MGVLSPRSGNAQWHVRGGSDTHRSFLRAGGNAGREAEVVFRRKQRTAERWEHDPKRRIIRAKMKVWKAALTSHSPMTAQCVEMPTSGSLK